MATESDQGRRLARFSVTPEIFVSLGRGVFEVIENALPEVKAPTIRRVNTNE